MMKKLCNYCGEKPVSYNHLWCSKECRDKDLELRKREREKQFEETKSPTIK